MVTFFFFFFKLGLLPREGVFSLPSGCLFIFCKKNHDLFKDLIKAGEPRVAQLSLGPVISAQVVISGS